MPYYTPLRYPGGKRRLTGAVMRLIDENGLRNIEYAEPFAGGAAIGLALLFGEYASVIHINDLARPVYAFWHTVLHQNAALCRRVERIRVTMAEWRRQRRVYENAQDAELDDLGFAALFLNRTNRSGIIGGGVIGGKAQDGDWALDVRFGKPELVDRIRRIGRYSSRIRLYQTDALQFVNGVVSKFDTDSFVFIDPPYIKSGHGLYLNDYTIEDHARLATRIERLKSPWIVTYDDVAIRYGLYQSRRRMAYYLHYVANSRHQGREVMFLSDRIRLPPLTELTGPKVRLIRHLSRVTPAAAARKRQFGRRPTARARPSARAG